jgi:hypothetical protein
MCSICIRSLSTWRPVGISRGSHSESAARLVTVREGAIVRLSFDGLRGTMVVGDVSATVFAVKPVQPALGTFHPLYPRGPEISDAPLFGPSNLIALRPFLEV